MEQSRQTVCVTGASGFVGRHTCAALIDQGYAVRALVRQKEHAARLPETTHLTIVQGDLFDRRALEALCDGAGSLVHAVGIRREYPSKGVTYQRLHPMAMRRVVDACDSAGITRLVLVSALGTRPEGATAYTRSKWEGEQILRSSGLDWTILRPSIIHGPDGEFMQMIKSWVLGRSSPRFFIPYFQRVDGVAGFPPLPKIESAQVQPVSVDDVAQAIVRSLERPESIGEIYPLVGPETYDWPTLMRTVRDALPFAISKPVLGLPAPVGYAIAQGARALGLADALPFGPSEPVMASEDSVANDAKARAHLGLHPKPFRETLAQYAAQI